MKQLRRKPDLKNDDPGYPVRWNECTVFRRLKCHQCGSKQDFIDVSD